MTLQVPLDRFSDTVKRILRHREVYVAPQAGGCLVTASLPAENILLVCRADHPIEEVRSALQKAGLEVHEGSWLVDGEAELTGGGSVAAFVAAVGYVSAEETPGVWVDAFASLPTPMIALRSMFDEFRKTGELPDITFEEFVRMAKPNVVIVSPGEIEQFLADKDGC